MRPVEAAYIAIGMLYQKRYNALFQFTDEEKAQNAKLDAETVRAKHLERVQIFESLLRGPSRSYSMRDLLTEAGHFFDDLGIEQAAEPSTSSHTAMQKGGH